MTPRSYGDIGQACARLAHAFKMHVVGLRRRAELSEEEKQEGLVVGIMLALQVMCICYIGLQIINGCLMLLVCLCAGLSAQACCSIRSMFVLCCVLQVMLRSLIRVNYVPNAVAAPPRMPCTLPTS